MDSFSDFPVQFLGRGVQNLDLVCANAPPFTMPRSRINQGFAAHTRLTIGRGVQGGASLDCINIRGKTDVLRSDLIQCNDGVQSVRPLGI